MRSQKGKRSRTSTAQTEETGWPVEFTETVHPCVMFIARPGDGSDIVAVIIRNRDTDTYTMRMRRRRADGSRLEAQFAEWLPPYEGGLPKEFRETLAVLETMADDGIPVKRLEFPKDVHPNNVPLMLAESGEVNFPEHDIRVLYT